MPVSGLAKFSHKLRVKLKYTGLEQGTFMQVSIMTAPNLHRPCDLPYEIISENAK